MEQLEGFLALNQSHHMKYVGRIGGYNILWNSFLRLEKIKFARSDRWWRFECADAPIPANHPPFFCKLHKFAWISGKNLPIFYSFAPGDRSVVSCRWNQPHFQKVQEINDQYINSDSYTLSQCKPPCYLINRSGLFCIQTARRSIFMQFANLQFQICKMPHHIAPWASARVLITAMSLISWNDFSSSP